MARHAPAAILLDLDTLVLNGTEATAAFIARHPEVASVVLTAYVGDTSILVAMRSGAE